MPKTPADLARAREAVASLADKRGTLIGRLEGVTFEEIGKIDEEIADAIDALLDTTDPCDAASEVPLVLLPVRVEMKADATRLRVRITPDEIHVDSLVRSVSDAERAAGEAYWTATWTGSTAAFEHLVDAVGARRAAWIAACLTPTNLPDKGAAGTTPQFPQSPSEVTRGTVARCLPDRFVVKVWHDQSEEPVTKRGRSIARDLPISPVALSKTDRIAAGVGPSIPEGSEWIIDFNAAVKAGMGVELVMPAGCSTLHKVVVVGVRASTDESASAADLADLLLSHRFSEGFGLLPFGTPTNNSDERSPFLRRGTPDAPRTQIDPPSADAGRLAAALGLDGDAVAAVVDGPSPQSSLEATERAANTALWFVTWGPVLSRLASAGVKGVKWGAIEKVRQLHRDHVRGAGNAPTMRIGAQPYGVLPVSDINARSGTYSANLAPLVGRTLERWVKAADRLPRIGPGHSVTGEDFQEILGMSPVATAVRARTGMDEPSAELFAKAAGAETLAKSQFTMANAFLSQYSVDAATMALTIAGHDKSRTLNLPLVSPRDADVIAAILDGQTVKVDSLLQALLDLAWEAHGTERDLVSPRDLTKRTADLGGISHDLVDLAESTSESPGTFFEAAAALRERQYAEDQPAGEASIADFEPVRDAQTSLAQVSLDLADHEYAPWLASQAIASLLEWAGRTAELREAMVALGASPIDERRIAVGHALDLASHRLDAWATGLAAERRAQLAGKAHKGLTIGAFGYVENISIGQHGAAPTGWIHAPTTGHATVAGVLASAHQANVGAKAGQKPFAIDLTSRRGRQVRRLVQGIDSGQRLGALLGYDIERALNGSPAARFQLNLRELAPMATTELRNTSAPVDADAAAAQARAHVTDVVDGLTLLAMFPPDDPTKLGLLWDALDKQPKSLYATAWSGPTSSERDRITEALLAAVDSVDALSDVALSETVFHLAAGNAPRASAALDTMGAGGSLDAEPAILDAHTSTKRLTHAALALVPEGAAGWSTTRIRAVAEPRLEAWAARRLGDPATVVVAEVGGDYLTLADAKLAALDVVFAADGAALDRELRAALPALGTTPLALTAGDGWATTWRALGPVLALARTLRDTITGASALEPEDLISAAQRTDHTDGSPVEHTRDITELLARTDALIARFTSALAPSAPYFASPTPILSVSPTEAAAITDALRPLAEFGVPITPSDDPERQGDVAWAWSVRTAAAAHLAAATPLRKTLAPGHTLDDAQVAETCQQIAAELLGSAFRIVPLLRPIGAINSFATAVVQPTFTHPSQPAVNAFVRDHGTVLAGMGRLAEAQLLGAALRRKIRLTVVQLAPSPGGVHAPGTDRWLAGPLPDDKPWPDTPVTHLIVELPEKPADAAGTVAGLCFEAWVEALPHQPGQSAFDPRTVNKQLQHAKATTGLAIQANQASARAPQVVLSLSSPDAYRWTTDRVFDHVLHAIDVAKARLVTLENAPDGAVLPAIYVASPWIRPAKSINFADLKIAEWDPRTAPFRAEVD